MLKCVEWIIGIELNIDGIDGAGVRDGVLVVASTLFLCPNAGSKVEAPLVGYGGRAAENVKEFQMK